MTTTIPEFDENDIKNYTWRDKEYYKLYMRERYRTHICRRVDCEICGKSVIYADIARHKKTIKCKRAAEPHKETLNDRIVRLEKIVSQLSNVSLDCLE